MEPTPAPCIGPDPGTSCTVRTSCDDPLRVAETFREEQGRLLANGDRPHALGEVQGQYMGLIRFTPSGWRRAAAVWQEQPPERRDRLDMTSLLRSMLARDVRVGALAIEGGCCEMGGRHGG